MPFFFTDTLTGQLFQVEMEDGTLTNNPIAVLPGNALAYYITDISTGQLYRIDLVDGVLVNTPIEGLPGSGVAATSRAIGLTVAQIIEMANKRTERRGKNLDLVTELLIVIQELAQERRWHWRKKSVKFSTVAGTAVYDLSTQSGMEGLTCERVCQEGPRIYLGAEQGCLSPIFETVLQEDARDSEDTGAPGQYFIDGQDQFRVVQIPDKVYSIRVPMWVLPDMTTLDGEVRLVPAYLHHALLKALEARIFRFTLGEGTAKYQAAMGEYQAAIQRASLNVNFAEGQVREWRSREEAIQST